MHLTKSDHSFHSFRALGAMVKGMGEASFDELLPWLMSTLTSEASSVDRSGAAQGLGDIFVQIPPDLDIQKTSDLSAEVTKFWFCHKNY